MKMYDGFMSLRYGLVNVGFFLFLCSRVLAASSHAPFHLFEMKDGTMILIHVQEFGDPSAGPIAWEASRKSRSPVQLLMGTPGRMQEISLKSVHSRIYRAREVYFDIHFDTDAGREAHLSLSQSGDDLDYTIGKAADFQELADLHHRYRSNTNADERQAIRARSSQISATMEHYFPKRLALTPSSIRRLGIQSSVNSDQGEGDCSEALLLPAPKKSE